MAIEWLPDDYDSAKFESSNLSKNEWLGEIEILKKSYDLIRGQLRKEIRSNREMGHFINISALIYLHAIIEQSEKLDKVKGTRKLEPKVQDQELHNKIQLLCLMRNAYTHNNFYNANDNNQVAVRNAVCALFNCDPQTENWRENEIPADRRRVVEPMFEAATQYLKEVL